MKKTTQFFHMRTLYKFYFSYEIGVTHQNITDRQSIIAHVTSDQTLPPIQQQRVVTHRRRKEGSCPPTIVNLYCYQHGGAAPPPLLPVHSPLGRGGGEVREAVVISAFLRETTTSS